MAEQFYTLVTNIGKAKIANSLLTGSKVNLTTMKIGDSNGNYYNPTESQTDIIHKVYECNITSVEIDSENLNWINITSIIPSDVGGFTIREAGIFDDSGNLIAIAKYPESYKPVAADGSTKELYIKITLEVSNTSSVTLKIDPTVIIATKSEVEAVKNQVNTIATEMQNAQGTYENLEARLDASDTQLSEKVNNTEVTTTPTANKLLKLNSNSKLPASITGDADSVDGIQGNQIPIQTTQTITYYVATTGSDTTGDGSVGNPFKTIQYAVNKLPQIINHTANINIGDGVYNEDVLIDGLNGKGVLTLTGTSTANTLINAIKINQCGIYVKLDKIQVTTTTKAGFNVFGCKYVNIVNCSCITSAPGVIGLACENSNVLSTSNTFSNRSMGIISYNCSKVFSNSSGGTGNVVGLYCESSSTIGKFGSQPTGTTNETISGGGVIR